MQRVCRTTDDTKFFSNCDLQKTNSINLPLASDAYDIFEFINYIKLSKLQTTKKNYYANRFVCLVISLRMNILYFS